nr:coproporphyrinogen dehydrogenase HemZ [uncultured Sellimonas sp.]
MMKLTCNDTLYTYDAYHLLKAFYPDEEIKQQVNEEQESQVRIETDRDSCFCVDLAGEESETRQMDRSGKKHLVISALYEQLSRTTGKRLPWGSLTGVRPTKMFMQKLEEGVPDQEILHWIEREHFVSEEKAELGLAIAKRERELLSRLDYEHGYSLYVGIPFCPTTCAYCSFTSYPIAQYLERTDAYLDALCKELSYIAEVSKEKKLNTIYLGGGTPTSLSAEQLDRLLGHLEKEFSYEHLLELTVEAGRPDSITREKLEVLKAHGIDRISVNPQTMQQKTLDLVGRRHTVEDVVRTFDLARELGFENINMDLIAGLPGETPEDMEDTLRKIKKLHPDSLTVHALAIKRASRLRQEQRSGEGFTGHQLSAGDLTAMIDAAYRCAEEMGLVPYYLYRQKNMAGNFENVGYAEVDKAGIYNILIMEEKQSIIAAGAGASTKIVLPEEVEMPGSRKKKMTKLIRIENVKNVDEYIARIDEMIERKGEWLWH